MVVQREYFTGYFKTQILGLEIDAEHVHRGLATNTTITNQNKRNWYTGFGMTRCWRSSTNCTIKGLLLFTINTSLAVIMALMCSKLITIALSLPSIVDGYDNTGSRTRRSRAGSPVRRITECFPSSSRCDCPDSNTTSHARIPIPFRRVCAGTMANLAISSSVLGLETMVRLLLECLLGFFFFFF